MSVDGSVELVFAGDLRTFRLGIAELVALQEKRNSGPFEIVARLQLGTWRVEDIIETIRIGLIGGGAGKPEEGKAARDLVEAHVRPPNVTIHVLTALAILLSALQGDPDNPVGKKKVKRTRKRATVSPPPSSTATG